MTENTQGNGEGGQARAFPWEPGSATGIGSMPGTDPAEAIQAVVDELPGFPFLPELPARGPGADLIGRTVALLTGFPVETTTGGWRLADRPGRSMRAAQSMLSSDLDAMEEQLAGYQGPLKISLAGPWTLAASIELARTLHPLLSDDGAVADLTASLAEAAAAHVAEVAKRVPGARLVVQLDEPSLPAVAYGEVPTASGLSRIPAPDVAVMSDRLQTILTATGQYSVVHCCAGPVPFDIIMTARPDAISFDLNLVRREDGDLIAEMADTGRGIFAGAVRTILPRNTRDDPPAQTARRVLRFWRALGMDQSQAARQIVLTPACGLAGATPTRAAEALAHSREAARIVPELAEEGSGDEQ
ncbi:MAG TPA: methionine synthase [Streptosporangiaceae bacterium]